MSPVTGFTRITKKIQDIILGSIILISISPILGLIALSIKLTSNGPVFFKQKRMGWNGLEINIYKFRTMCDHQETELEITQAHKNDKRVTNLGRFLRKTSLDELPQFINVLQGRMSIVGPRPHAMAHNEIYKELVPGYMLRHKVKPGITGWAQIHGYRGETDQLVKMEKRVEYDKFYIENMSLGLDLKIIFLTVFKGFLNKNAY
jgi:putative colanic acid biosynthesis UDP-glucose lipid carrier transferase